LRKIGRRQHERWNQERKKEREKGANYVKEGSENVGRGGKMGGKACDRIILIWTLV